MEKESFSQSIERELKENILSFWINNTIDKEYGGFRGQIDNQGNINKKADKSLILTSRILWTFSAMYNYFSEKKYLQIADRAYDYLLNYFYDEKYGGFFWMVTNQGEPVARKKQIYGQAFAVYALAEYFNITERREVKKLAVETYEKIEEYSHDSKFGGYIEAFARDWGELEDLSLSTKDMNQPKSMNTHLHILEAYTNLHRIYPHEKLKNGLKQLIDIFVDHIIDEKRHQQVLFFDLSWEECSQIISFGHDIEASWLLCEAAEELPGYDIDNLLKETVLPMVERVIAEGWDDKQGGLYYEFAEGKYDKSKHWWPQAEALVGFMNAYQITGNKKYYDFCTKTWEYILENFSDHRGGAGFPD